MTAGKVTIEKIFRSTSVKNKIRRLALYQLDKKRKSKNRRQRREQRLKERKILGDEAPPKEAPRTIENLRIADETRILDDSEVTQDDNTDEFAAYFDCTIPSKVLITSSERPSLKSHLLMKELKKCIPNSDIRLRNNIEVKKIIPQAISRDYTNILIINEDRKMPNGLLIVHLPEGPSALFKLSSFRRGYNIKGHGKPTSHKPEVMLNNFSTRLGHTVGRMFASLFPHHPQFKGRQVVTFHNQRDFIFFRYHRYIFKNAKRVGMQELGPRFTLKLQSLQKGTFDSKCGEYYWIYKRGDTERRKFYL